MPALYTSVLFETAWLEAKQAFPFKAQPMTICGYEVECEDVLDLTDAAVLAEVGVARAELGCAWEDLSSRGTVPPSWALVRRLVGAGVAGVVVPSFARGAGLGDVNVVFWDWSGDLPHRVRMVDDHGRLPRDRRSWGQAEL